MAAYNVTLTPALEAALDVVLAKLNAMRAAEDPPAAALTKAQAVQGAVVNRIRQEYAQIREQDGSAVVDRLRHPDVTDAQIAQVKSILGLT
jgi:hypothetical protein